MIPSATHPLWRDLVCGKRKPQFSNLGLQFLMSDIARRLATDRSEGSIQKKIDEVRWFFIRHELAVGEELTELLREYGETP